MIAFLFDLKVSYRTGDNKFRSLATTVVIQYTGHLCDRVFRSEKSFPQAGILQLIIRYRCQQFEQVLWSEETQNDL